MTDAIPRVERDSSFELLRIVAIVFVILFHIASFGNWEFPTTGSGGVSAQVLFIHSMRPLGKIGVDLFILISGYFLYNKFKFKFKKLAKLWLQVFFISVLLGSVFMIAGQTEVTTQNIIGMVTPVLTGKWWFVRHYLIVLLISPVLNMITSRIGNKGHLLLVIACLSLDFYAVWYCDMGVEQHSTFWFTMLYFVGSFLRRNSDRLQIGFIIPLVCAFVFYGLSVYCLYLVDCNEPGWDFTVHEMIIDSNSPFTFAISVSIFIAFMNLRIKHNKWINLVASTTFGIYLFHDYPQMRRWLWSDVFDCSRFGDIPGMVMYVLYCLLTIFIAFMVLEYLRKRCFEDKVVVPLLKE